VRRSAFPRSFGVLYLFHVITGLVPVMTICRTPELFLVEMAGTNPAMT